MTMNEAVQGEIMARLDGLGNDMKRIEANVQGINGKLDVLASQGHEVRIQALEKRLDGMWAKVTGLVALVCTGVMLIFSLLRG